MKYKLSKCSSPSWTKEFLSERECREELVKHICNQCLAGDFTYVGSKGELITVEGEPIDSNCLGALLSTSCGCEFEYEEVWEEYE